MKTISSNTSQSNHLVLAFETQVPPGELCPGFWQSYCVPPKISTNFEISTTNKSVPKEAKRGSPFKSPLRLWGSSSLMKNHPFSFIQKSWTRVNPAGQNVRHGARVHGVALRGHAAGRGILLQMDVTETTVETRKLSVPRRAVPQVNQCRIDLNTWWIAKHVLHFIPLPI